jgi:hypothetical protein
VPEPTSLAGLSDSLDAPALDLETPSDAPEIEIVYERPVASPATGRKRAAGDVEADYDLIALPRYVIFVQGGLLGSVGLLCFLLGMAVGGALTERTAENEGGAMPISISGTVARVRGDSRDADAAAVVIFVPADARPEDKPTLVGVRPGDDPARGVPIRDALRAMGGGLATCDQRGQYTLQLPSRGRYFLLAISALEKPPGLKPPPPAQILQMGQFFNLAQNPLQEFRYQWRQETLRGSGRVNVNFD